MVRISYYYIQSDDVFKHSAIAFRVAGGRSSALFVINVISSLRTLRASESLQSNKDDVKN